MVQEAGDRALLPCGRPKGEKETAVADSFAQRLTAIDDAARGDHWYLRRTDVCRYLGEYAAGKGAAYSAVNGLILDFKMAVSRAGRRDQAQKDKAIGEAAALRRALEGSVTEGAVFVPVPPSRARDDGCCGAKTAAWCGCCRRCGRNGRWTCRCAAWRRRTGGRRGCGRRTWRRCTASTSRRGRRKRGWWSWWTITPDMPHWPAAAGCVFSVQVAVAPGRERPAMVRRPGQQHETQPTSGSSSL